MISAVIQIEPSSTKKDKAFESFSNEQEDFSDIAPEELGFFGRINQWWKNRQGYQKAAIILLIIVSSSCLLNGGGKVSGPLI